MHCSHSASINNPDINPLFCKVFITTLIINEVLVFSYLLESHEFSYFGMVFAMYYLEIIIFHRNDELIKIEEGVNGL